MLDFMGSWHAQTNRFMCWLSFAAESGFDFGFVFDVDEPGSRRGSQRQADQAQRCLSEVSSAHPATIVMTSGAPQGIRLIGSDGETTVILELNRSNQAEF